MTHYLLQLYGDIDDLCNTRILDELEYYMYEVKHKNEMIFFFIKEQSIYIHLDKDSNWTLDKLQTLCRTALRENVFMLIKIDYFTGYTNFWSVMLKESETFYKDPTTFRVGAGRGNKLQKLMSRIKRTLTPNKDK